MKACHYVHLASVNDCSSAIVTPNLLVQFRVNKIWHNLKFPRTKIFVACYVFLGKVANVQNKSFVDRLLSTPTYIAVHIFMQLILRKKFSWMTKSMTILVLKSCRLYSEYTYMHISTYHSDQELHMYHATYSVGTYTHSFVADGSHVHSIQVNYQLSTIVYTFKCEIQLRISKYVINIEILSILQSFIKVNIFMYLHMCTYVSTYTDVQLFYYFKI